MTAKILCVDDDSNILESYRRQLRKTYAVEVSLGGEAGLETIKAQGPFAVVVSDMQMPGMNGVQFLRHVREVAPDTVRIMLTGKADLSTSVEAVNEGHIFRFLTKPCPPEKLTAAIDAGVEQYRLIRAEKELLEKTLAGSVRTLIEILSVVDPHSFGRSQKLRTRVREVVRALNIPDLWKVEVAAMFSQIGNVTIPPQVLSKSRTQNHLLTGAEKDMLARVPLAGSKLLGNIPRLEGVAEIVRYQFARFDGKGLLPDAPKGVQLPVGARVLRVLHSLEEMEAGGHSPASAFEAMRLLPGVFDPDILDRAQEIYAPGEKRADQPERPGSPSSVADLQEGWTLATDVVMQNGHLLIAGGHKLNEAMLDRLRNFHKITGVREPVMVHKEDEKAGKSVSPPVAGEAKRS